LISQKQAKTEGIKEKTTVTTATANVRIQMVKNNMLQLKGKFVFSLAVKLIVLVALAFVSCQENISLDQFHAIEKQRWHKDSIIDFPFTSSDSENKNNIYINIRNNKTYEYSNLFLIARIEFPNNYQIVDTLEYEMTTPEGRFLGTGISDVLENKLEYKTKFTFPLKGEYHIRIQHAMRKNQELEGMEYLDGIVDVGLQIEKIK
jgi:gliding motility-associated lipoprotein GldH